MIRISKLVLTTLVLLSLSVPFAVLAQQAGDVSEPSSSGGSNCEINGKPVPCEEVTEAFKGFAMFAGVFAIAMVVLAIAGGVFWLIMLVHAASNPIENKAMWIILQVLTGIIGSIVYYFVVKRKWNAVPQAAPVPHV